MMQRLLQSKVNTRNNQCTVRLTDKKLNLLWMLIMLFWSSRTMCEGAVSFVFQPRNQTVKEGEPVRFECAYQGGDLTPLWRINSSVYSHTQLPSIYHFNDQDFSLTVDSVPGSLNFTSFQCIVGTIFSNQGYLFVKVDKENTTNCIIECSASTTKSDVETTPEITATGSSVNATLSTVNSSDELKSQLLSVTVPIVVSITLLVSITSITLLLFGIIVTVTLLWRRKPSISESVHQQDNIIKVGDNEAYAAIEKYGKPIETENNVAYYDTSNFVLDHSLQCNSPQA